MSFDPQMYVWTKEQVGSGRRWYNWSHAVEAAFLNLKEAQKPFAEIAALKAQLYQMEGRIQELGNQLKMARQAQAPRDMNRPLEPAR